MIDGAISGPDRFAWSRDGNLAAVFASGSRSAQVLREAARPPRRSAAIAVGVDGEISALAIDSAGDLLAGASSESGGVYLLSGDSPRLILKPPGRPPLSSRMASAICSWRTRPCSGSGRRRISPADSRLRSSPTASLRRWAFSSRRMARGCL